MLKCAYVYSKTCLKGPLKKKTKNGFQDQLWLSVVKRPLKNRQDKVLKTNASLMKVESIAESSRWSILNTFDLQLVISVFKTIFGSSFLVATKNSF